MSNYAMRKAFETAMRKLYAQPGDFLRNRDGQYVIRSLRDSWLGWMECAAVAAQADADAVKRVEPEALANAIIREMCELSDRTSPEDEPGAMIANAQEMRGCVERALESLSVITDAPAAPTQSEATPVDMDKLTKQRFQECCDALPVDVSWGDSLTPDIVRHILDSATPAPVKPAESGEDKREVSIKPAFWVKFDADGEISCTSIGEISSKGFVPVYTQPTAASEVSASLAEEVLAMNRAWNRKDDDSQIAGHLDMCRRLALEIKSARPAPIGAGGALTDAEILSAFRIAGLNLSDTPNLMFSVRGQQAQLVKAARALLAKRGGA